MKSILISIRPQWVAQILNWEKTIEIRKTAPKCDLPIDVYIYCTKEMYILDEKIAFNHKWSGKVVAKFTLRNIEKINFNGYFTPSEYSTDTMDVNAIMINGCIGLGDLVAYLKNRGGYAWRISELDTLDYPIPLSALGAKSAPQSWVYIESDREPIYARKGRCEAYCDGRLIGGNYFLHITMNGSEIMHQKWAVMPTKAQAEEILAALNPEGI